MGPYLTTPKKEKDSVDGESAKYKYGATGMQGWRNTMEDSHIVELDLGNGAAFVGVYDGHGGAEVAMFVRDYLIKELKTLDSFKQQNYEECLKEIYLKLDRIFQTDFGKKKLGEYRGQQDG